MEKGACLVPPVAGGQVADDEVPKVARRRRTASFWLQKMELREKSERKSSGE